MTKHIGSIFSLKISLDVPYSGAVLERVRAAQRMISSSSSLARSACFSGVHGGAVRSPTSTPLINIRPVFRTAGGFPVAWLTAATALALAPPPSCSSSLLRPLGFCSFAAGSPALLSPAQCGSSTAFRQQRHVLAMSSGGRGGARRGGPIGRGRGPQYGQTPRNQDPGTMSLEEFMAKANNLNDDDYAGEE
jgi:hypothetical protein